MRSFKRWLTRFCIVVTWVLVLSLLALAVVWRTQPRGTLGHWMYLLLVRHGTDVAKQHHHAVIWRDTGPNREIWGYVNKHSIKPGESFHLMLSTRVLAKVRGHVEIFRIGGYQKTDRKRVWKSPLLWVRRGELSATAASLGPNWQPHLWKFPTQRWRSGYYAIDFVATNNKRTRDVAYMVVTNPKQQGDILVKLSTNTYQAYNQWGGHSFYKSAFVGERGHMVSFDRPTISEFYRWEYYFVLWVERFARKQGLSIDYVSDFDVHSDPAWTQNYKLLISVGHDEYWTKEMFDHIYDRIFRLGKHTLFLGANTAYWQVRYGDLNATAIARPRGRQMICYKTLQDPIRHAKGAGILDVTARFRDGYRRPETMLMGVGYQSYFRPKDDFTPRYRYYVADHALPFFRGTGYRNGDSLGFLVGYEWDNRTPGRGRLRFWHPKFSRIAPIIYKTVQLVFSGSAIDFAGRKGKAEGVYFVSKAGAKVFSSGTIRWPWGLNKPGFADKRFRALNRNLLLHLLQPKTPTKTKEPPSRPR